MDKVVRDVLERLADVQSMSEELLHDACRHLLRPALTATRAMGKMPEAHIVIFNLDTRPRGGFCGMDIDLPLPNPPAHVRLVTGAGREIVPHMQALFQGGADVRALVGRPMPTQRCRLQFEAPEIPPMSWLALKVAPAAPDRISRPPLVGDGCVLENDFLKAVARGDGRLDLTDKATGASYEGLHYFEDVGDAGDPWHFRPVGETVATAGPAEIKVVEDTPWRAAIEVTVSVMLPADRLAAATECAPDRRVRIASRLSLTRSGRRLDIETTIENTCRHHRLRVCFPTGIAADTTYAGGQFSVDERPTKQPDMSAWIEKVDGYPNYGFAGLSDGRRGLAILNLGLPEYFVTGPGHDILALTLLRTMRLKWRPAAAGEDYAIGLQQLGPQTVRYALYPHAGGWREGKLWQAYRDFSRPLLCATMLGAVRTGGASMLALDAADLEVACVKRAEREDGLIVRIWNPTDAAREGRLTLGVPFRSVAIANLNEDPRDDADGDLRVSRRTVRLIVGARKILTLLFRFPGRADRRRVQGLD
jgi:hypothetical protein